MSVCSECERFRVEVWRRVSISTKFEFKTAYTAMNVERTPSNPPPEVNCLVSCIMETLVDEAGLLLCIELPC
jgi:hypothetical protein